MTWQTIEGRFRARGYELLLIVVTLQVFLLVWPVGEYLVLDDWAFVKSLEHLHIGGELVVLDWNPMTLTGHLLWGLLFTKFFGFSFFMTKVSVGCAGGLVVLLVYWIAKRHGAHPTVALIAGLAVLLNPLFLAHMFMYMTDVTGLMWQWLSLGCISLAFATGGQRRACFLIASSALWGLAFLTRQHGVTVPLSVGAYMLLFDRSLFRVSIVFPAFLPGIWIAGNGFAWHSLTRGNTTSFQASSELIFDFLRNPPWIDLPFICWSYAVYVGLFAAPVVLAVPWDELRSLTGMKFVLIVISIWVGIFLFIHYSMNGWYFPYIRNVITPFGMFQPHEFVMGDRDLLWCPEYGIIIGLCGILAAVCWAAMICQQKLNSDPSTPDYAFDHSICARRLLLLLFGCQLAYVLATAPILYDRHLILLIPTVCAISALVTSKLSRPQFVAPGVVIIGYAAYSIACSHDIHAMSRAVFLEGQNLRDSGIGVESIDAGYAFDGWHMYERSRAVSPAPALYMPVWWPKSVSTTPTHFAQPWWIYILNTEVRPKYVVAISSKIPSGHYMNGYRFEEIESSQRYWTYWPLREQRVHVFRCHPIGAQHITEGDSR